MTTDAASYADGATARIARFIVDARPQDLSAHAIRLATDAITDAIGVGLYGSLQPAATCLQGVIDASTGGRHALLGSPLRASALEAALHNGTAIHAIDYDDTAHPSYSHPSAHIVPLLLSLGREHRRGGPELLLAWAIGLEIEGKLGMALNMGHYLKGWHTTGTFGALSSAAAAARLAGLDFERTRIALGIAASQASGVRANFGTMTKPLHAGLAARAGVLAVSLAAGGFTAASSAIETRYGYLDAFRADAAPDVRAFEALGRPWEVDSPYGIAIKPFPACGSTHTAIEAALTLRKQLAGETIRAVRVGTNELADQTLIHHDPRTPLEGKFSMEFCVAAALVRGEVVIDTFAQEAIDDPAIRALIPRTTMEVDERVRHNGEHGTVVRVTTESGRTLEQLVPLATGKPERWLDTDLLWRKFLDCSAPVLGPARARQAFDVLQELPRAHGIDPVLEAIAVREPA